MDARIVGVKEVKREAVDPYAKLVHWLVIIPLASLAVTLVGRTIGLWPAEGRAEKGIVLMMAIGLIILIVELFKLQFSEMQKYFSEKRRGSK